MCTCTKALNAAFRIDSTWWFQNLVSIAALLRAATAEDVCARRGRESQYHTTPSTTHSTIQHHTQGISPPPSPFSPHLPDDLSGDALPFLVLTRFHPFHVRVRFCVAPLVDDRIRTDVGADIQLDIPPDVDRAHNNAVALVLHR